MCWLRSPSVPLPTHWNNSPSSLEYDLFQIFWYLGCFRSCLQIRDCPVYSSVIGIAQSRIKSYGYCQPEAFIRETRLSVYECMRRYMVLVGIGNCGDWWYRVHRSTGYGKYACWGWYVSTLGVDESILGVGAAAPVKCTLGDCAAGVGLGTLGGGGVGGMRVLFRCMRSLIFSLGSGDTVVNWYRSAHCLKRSMSYVISLLTMNHK